MSKEKKRTFKRKLFIVSRYIKHYSPWVVLLLIGLLTAKILHKNYSQNEVITATENYPVKIESVKRAPTELKSDQTLAPDTKADSSKEIETISRVTQVEPDLVEMNNTKVALLEKELLEERKKNKNLAHSLNDQEQQLISALNNITDSYNLELRNSENNSKATNPERTSIGNSEYYSKVRAALDEKPSLSENTESQDSLSTNKLEETITSNSDEG